MSARPYKFTTAASTNLQLVAQGPCVLKGASLVNTTDDPYYVKLYWFRPTSSAAAPTVGTTVPDITIAAPPLENTNFGLPGTLCPSWPEGVVAGPGQLWVAVTGAAADNDTTNVGSGQGVITLLVDGAP
jgi:hypothetical protein